MKLIKLNAIDSTNTYLKELNKNMTLEDELIVLTNEQTKGRGQHGNHWQSTKGKSLVFSVFKRFTNLGVMDQINCLFAVSLGVMNALEKLGIPNLSIKWPNDIMSDTKKVCGILIENQIKSNKVTAAIIGIGINVNETEFDQLPKASSLFLMSGKAFKLEDVLEVVTNNIFYELNKLSTESFDILRAQYESVLFRRFDKSVFEDTVGNQFKGSINGITGLGALIIEKEDKSLVEFQSQEIKLLF